MSNDNSLRTQTQKNFANQLCSFTKVFVNRLITRKPMLEVQAQIDTNNELRRALNWFQLLSIGVGTTIGK